MGALTIAGPLAREIFARFTAIDLRPQVTPVHGFRPGSVARTPGAILREAEDRWLMLFGAALGQLHLDGRGRRRGEPRRRARRRGRAGGGGRRCLTSSARRRMWRRRSELKDSYDVVIIGGGSHGLAAAYYLARDHGIERRRRAREELHRLGRGRAQHDDPALELQDRRGRALLRRLAQALRGARRAAQLQPAVLAERPPHAGPLGPRDVRDGQPRRGQPDQRDRLAPDLPGRDQEARAGDAGRQPGRRLSDPGRALPPARRRDPPRRRRLGAGARRRPRRRRDPPLHRGDRHRPLERARDRRADQPRPDQGRARCSTAPPAGAR